MFNDDPKGWSPAQVVILDFVKAFNSVLEGVGTEREDASIRSMTSFVEFVLKTRPSGDLQITEEEISHIMTSSLQDEKVLSISGGGFIRGLLLALQVGMQLAWIEVGLAQSGGKPQLAGDRLLELFRQLEGMSEEEVDKLAKGLMFDKLNVNMN